MSSLGKGGLLRKSVQLQAFCGIDKKRHPVYDDSDS